MCFLTKLKYKVNLEEDLSRDVTNKINFIIGVSWGQSFILHAVICLLLAYVGRRKKVDKTGYP